MHVDTKKNLLGLYLLWGVVASCPLGECRVQGVIHIVRLLLFSSLAIHMASPKGHPVRKRLKFHLRPLVPRATFRVFTSSSPWHTQSSVQGINSIGSPLAKRWPSKNFPVKPATRSHLLKLCFIVMVIQ